ncbi:MAG TPA: hypothetical protein VLA67_06045 [Nitrospiraceae bacterium]|nr:hypothetical protein [Nitrospiraceae bacterium]
MSGIVIYGFSRAPKNPASTRDHVANDTRTTGDKRKRHDSNQKFEVRWSHDREFLTSNPRPSHQSGSIRGAILRGAKPEGEKA